MSKMSWGKFYWSDWEADERLKLCSPGAQALWMRMLCVCAKAEGYLTVNEHPIGTSQLAVLIGWPLEDVEKWWSELEQWGVFSRDRRGVVFSRRMVRDEKRASILRKNGKMGGNPSLGKNRENPALDNQGVNHEDNPEPRVRARINQKLEARSQKKEETNSIEFAKKKSDEDEVGDDAFDEVRDEPDHKKRAWDGALVVLVGRGGLTTAKARRFIGGLVKDNALTHDDLWAIAEAAWEVGTRDPVPYFTASARARRKQPGEIGVADREIQVRWMEAFAEDPDSWRPERGPRPGERGCRVFPDVMLDHGVKPWKEKAATSGGQA